MRFHRLFSSIKRRLNLPAGHVSYAQCGEDLILQHLFQSIGMARPRYVDVGAHHPYHFSNTFLFYQSGSDGVVVEPDPSLAALFRRKRPRDQVVEAGIGRSSDTLTFFRMSSPSLSTFSASEAQRLESLGFAIIDRIDRPVLDVNEFAHHHFAEGIDLLSVDVEGLDEEILREWDMVTYRPKVIRVESIEFGRSGKPVRRDALLEMLCQRGFELYAETGVNAILLDPELWAQRCDD